MKYHRHLLTACVEAVNSIFFEDRYADKCIEYFFRNNKKWGGRDRRFFAETVYDCVRWWRLDWYLMDRPEQAPDLAYLSVSLWRRGLSRPEFEEFEKVDFTTFSKRMNDLNQPAIKHAYPDWLYERINSQLGQKKWHDLAPYTNATNAVVLRTNRTKGSRDALIGKLSKEGIDSQALAGTDQGVILNKRANVFQSQAFKEGLFEVQDGSSQQVAGYLDIEPGQRVIDACAGAGGKTLHIADLLQNKGKVISLDIHQWKLDQLKLRARRDGFSNIEMKAIDSTKVIKRLSEKADRLLLDVPCTGLGVLRRNPDTKWKLTEARIEELKTMQAQILNDYSKMLKKGGKLLYATCSILPEENQDQIETFLSKNQNFQLLKQRHIFPVIDGFDGFYMALLQKH